MQNISTFITESITNEAFTGAVTNMDINPIKTVFDAGDKVKTNKGSVEVDKRLAYDGKGVVYCFTDVKDNVYMLLDGIYKKLMLKNADIFEGEIKSADDFKEYATTVLKQAHGDDFNKETADKLVSDLVDKHGDDYGAMQGALTAGLSECDDKDMNENEKLTSDDNKIVVGLDTAIGFTTYTIEKENVEKFLVEKGGKWCIILGGAAGSNPKPHPILKVIVNGAFNPNQSQSEINKLVSDFVTT